MQRKTELGMKVEVTPLANAVEELDQLKQDLKDLHEKIKKQEEKVDHLMCERKQYEISVGDWKYVRTVKEEKVIIKRVKR